MKITISRKKGEPLNFKSRPDDKILHAALRNRLAVPYECATGTCGSCRAKLVSGSLDDGWIEAPGRKTLKAVRGEFLMCQASALSDCEIRIPATIIETPLSLSAPNHLRGSVTNQKMLTGDVMSFSVVLEESVCFHAGQFVTLQFQGIDGARAYSMVNHAPQTDQLDFVIKRLAGGKCSEMLFGDPLKSRDVTLFGPLGHAIFEPDLGHNLLLLAGGSGIAGMMAMLEQADQIGYLNSHRIELVFGVRTQSDVFFLPALQEHANHYPDNLKVTIALSEQAPVTVSGLPSNLQTSQGFVHQLIGDVPDYTDTMAFIAGPPPMVDASIRELVGARGLTVDKIRYDKYS